MQLLWVATCAFAPIRSSRAWQLVNCLENEYGRNVKSDTKITFLRFRGLEMVREEVVRAFRISI